MRRFLAELSQPRNAVEVFLPVLYASFFDVSFYSTHLLYNGDNGYERNYREWRTVREGVALNTKVTPAEGTARPVKSLEHLWKYSLRMSPRYAYHLETFTDNIRLKLIGEMQTCLEPFLTSLRFLANLHCAQLALSRRKIETMDSGQYEPDTRKHPLVTQRTYPEMESKIANELANPAQEFTARCKLGTKEYTSQAEETETLRKADAPAVVQARRDRIIEQTRLQYCKKREDVVREIKARQDALTKRE